MGLCCVHTPYSWTSLGCVSFLKRLRSLCYYFLHPVVVLQHTKLQKYHLSQHLFIISTQHQRARTGNQGAKHTTHIMTLASSMKSSSYMAPSRIALMATLYCALHFPRRTTPNRPLPSSLMNVSSEGLISHFSIKQNRLADSQGTYWGGRE